MVEKKESKTDKSAAKESYSYSVKLSSSTEGIGASSSVDASTTSVNDESNQEKVEVEKVSPDEHLKMPKVAVRKQRVEIPSSSPSQPYTGAPLDPKSEQVQKSLAALKNNPEAMKMLKKLVKSEKPPTIGQRITTAANQITVKNVKKATTGLLKGIDGFISFVTKKEGANRNDVLQKARSPILFGFWVVVVTFFIAGIWSGVAPLDKASHAMGFVVTDSKKQIIQHREGGILEEINVKEGEEVEAGQVLARLSDIQIKTGLDGLRAQKNSFEKQLEIIREQLTALEDLQQKGFVSKTQLLEAQSKEAQLIAQLSDAEAKIADYEERLGRLSVIAPVSGIVNQIQVHTKGGTVPSGGTLMTITPKDESLVVEAYVSPDDIDAVHIGLKSKVRISAFKHRSTAPLDGVVSFVSSDVFEPPQGNYAYSQEGLLLQRDPKGLKYKVRVEIDKDQLKKISKYRDYELYPGMQADVTIVIGERTLLQYLLDPITTTFWFALKEQ